MHRLVAILLIPIFVVGNSFAHSHGSAAHSPASHQRAHIHVGGDDHHEHGHAAHGHDHGHKRHGEHHPHEDEHESNGAQQEPIAPPVDHDSDAIYLVASDFATTSTGRVSIELDYQLALPQFGVSFVDSPAKIPCPQPHKSPPFELPLYLLHAALRL
jgi:hypothetical protein